MIKAILCLGGCLILVAALNVRRAAGQAAGDGPQYTSDGQLRFPKDYREWVFLSSGLGMTYGPAAAGARDDPRFDNVFVNRSAYKSFLASGRWPDKTVFILEVGVLGVALIFLLYFLLWRDAIAVSHEDEGLTRAIAAGWVGVVAMMAASTFYSVVHTYAAPSYLFWYVSGIVAARRAQLKYARDRVPTPLTQRAAA